MSEPVRIGVIGCGRFMRAQHIQTIARSPHLTLEHVADRDAEALAAVADRYGPRRTSTDWRQVVRDDRVQVVVAGLVPHLHAQVALAALEADKPTYVEKPIARSLADAREIQRLALRRQVPLAVGFNRRFAPAVKLLASILDAQTRPISIMYRISDDHRVDPPSRAWKKQDRLLIELVHIFDLLAYLVRAEPRTIYATETRFNDAIVTVRFADGSSAAILSSSYGSLAQPKEHLEAVLDGAAAEMDDFVELRTYGLADAPARVCFAGRAYDGCDNSHVDAFARDGIAAYLELRKRYNDAMLRSGVLTDRAEPAAWARAQQLLGDPPVPQINYCCDKGWAEALETFCIRAARGLDTSPVADARDACRATACALAARESIETGRPIELDESNWNERAPHTEP